MQPTKWSFTPAVEEILAPPPAPQPDPPQAQTRAEPGLGFVVTVANVLLTAIIITGMIVRGTDVGSSILIGAGYFALTTGVYILALTGTLTDVIRGGQQQRTERLRIEVYADLAEQAIQWRLLIEQNRKLELESQAIPADLSRRLAALETEMLERSLPADPQQTPSFVTPYDNRSPRAAGPSGRGQAAHAAETQAPHDTTAGEALAWAMTLYTDTGLPDPKRVQLRGKAEAYGKIRGEVIGSKRGEGSREALLWLLDKRVLKKIPGGYALNLAAFPRREELRYIR